ncbi:MAG: glutamate--tRNA ligase [Armatimonadetes bacterium]|nr:glutamate--tRNA ligase [Armatimonadota bacterium]
MTVRVRYAPSPTGSPHVGNIRTALYNHLFAKRHGGVNIVRIEDTDRARTVEGCEAEILESLRYVGVEWQEGVGSDGPEPSEGPFGPYRQSERNAAGIYGPHWRRLIEQGDAYWAFDTSEELEAMRKEREAQKLSTGYFGGEWRDAPTAKVEAAQAAGKPGVVRLKVPRGLKIVVEDAVRGRIEHDSDLVDDPVLIKADGMPTYHFAAMVDDHLMEVTHIFRGEEWISSAPKHVVLFGALGWTPPVMVHLPVIKGKDGSKLSKRHGDTACLDFRRAGFLGRALANFIALIGWSPGGDREVMSMDEMAEAFDLKGVQPSSGVFDADKLQWMSGVHVRNSGPQRLADEVRDYAGRQETERYWSARVPSSDEVDPHVRLDGLRRLASADPRSAEAAVALLQERVTNLADFGPACRFLFVETVDFDPKAVEKWFHEPHVPDLFRRLSDKVTGMTAHGHTDYEVALKACQTEMGIEKLGPVVHPVRVALTGSTVGPGLFELMAVLGPERIVKRLQSAIGDR